MTPSNAPAEIAERIGNLCSLEESDPLRVTAVVDEPGVVEVSGQPNPRVIMHTGKPVRIACKRGDDSHVGVTATGDIDIVPAGMPSRWEVYGTSHGFVFCLSQTLLNSLAAKQGSGRVELHNRFQMRSPQIEHIGWALKAECEQGFPSGQLYLESLAAALAVEIARSSGLQLKSGRLNRDAFSKRKLNHLLAYIDKNLGNELTLEAMANQLDVSISTLKEIFRREIGMPLHQYVIRRRVERAADLLAHCKRPISEVALETGFAHQSHLARHMRRMLGVLPADLRKRI